MEKATKKSSSYMSKSSGMKSGGSLEMVEKDGKKVPAFAADGKGKMKAGGAMHKMPDGTMMPGKKHKMADGGAVKKKAGSKMKDAQKYRAANARGAGPGVEGRAKIRAAEKIADKADEATVYGLRSEGSRKLGQDYARKIGGDGASGKYKAGGKVRGMGAAQKGGNFSKSG